MYGELYASICQIVITAVVGGSPPKAVSNTSLQVLPEIKGLQYERGVVWSV